MSLKIALFAPDIIFSTVNNHITNQNLPALLKQGEPCDHEIIISDKERALNPHQDLFLTPVRIGEIIDKIRSYHAQAQAKDIVIGERRVMASDGALVSHLSQKPIIDKEGKPLFLTEKEHDILKLLVQNRGESISRQHLLKHVWNYAESVETHTLETHIYRLRQKIEPDAANPQFLLTDEKGYWLSQP